MVVARLLGDFTRHQPARALEIEHEDLRFEKRGVHPLPLAAHLALKQGHHNALGEQQPGAEIVDWDADPYRSLTRHTGDRHQPAHTLRDLVDARPLVIGPGLAKAGDAAVDDARIDFPDRLVVDAEPEFYLRAEILDDNIGFLRQLEKYRLALFAL